MQGLTQQSKDLIEWFQREASCPRCRKEHLVPDFLRVSHLVMNFGNHTIYMRKNNKTFRIKAYTQKVHEQENHLVDNWSEITEFETNLLACNPTKIVQILARGQLLPQKTTTSKLDNVRENQSVASDSLEMNWLHALATTDAMYPIGTKLLRHKLNIGRIG